MLSILEFYIFIPILFLKPLLTLKEKAIILTLIFK